MMWFSDRIGWWLSTGKFAQVGSARLAPGGLLSPVARREEVRAVSGVGVGSFPER